MAFQVKNNSIISQRAEHTSFFSYLPSWQKIAKVVGILALLIFSQGTSVQATQVYNLPKITPNDSSFRIIPTPFTKTYSLEYICPIYSNNLFNQDFTHYLESEEISRSLSDYYNLKPISIEITQKNAQMILAELEDSNTKLAEQNLQKAYNRGICITPPEKVKQLCKKVLSGEIEQFRLQSIRLNQKGCEDAQTLQIPSKIKIKIPPSEKLPLHQLNIVAYMGKAQVTTRPAILTTPQYVHSYLHPGLCFLDDGKKGYEVLNQKPLPKKKAKQIIGEVEESLSQLSKSVNKSIFKKKETDTKGFVIQSPRVKEKLLFGVNPQKLENSKKAMDFLTTHVVKAKHLFKPGMQNDNNFIARILQTHEILFSNIKGLDFIPGQIRDGDLIVFKDEEMLDRSVKSFRKKISQVGTKADLIAFDESIELLKKQGTDFNDMFHNMTPNQRKAWEKLGYIPPHHAQVRSCLLHFVKELKENYFKMQRTGSIDYIALASFAFRRICEIHPFGDGNGRLARAVMNGLLMRGGIPPVAFLNDGEYTLAAEREMSEPGYFAKYLVDKINQNQEILG